MSTHPGSSERGVALLMVVTVLVTLVMIAVPFALSMRQGHERTMTEQARGQAQWEAQILLEAMKHALAETHPSQEQQRWAAGERAIASDPNVDSLEEITLGEEFRERYEELWVEAAAGDPAGEARLQALKARGLGPLNNDMGSIWSGVVEDANGKVNPNGASPFLVGNLFGSALLAEEIDASSPDISVSNVVQSQTATLAGFAPDGGFVRIGREVIKYDRFDGDALRGCERGVLTDSPLGDNGAPESHEKNTPVIDYVAYKIATHLIAARPGNLTYYHNLEDLRSISGWGAGSALPRGRLDGLRAFLSPHSRREMGESWLAPQVIANELPGGGEDGGSETVEVKDLQNPTGTTAFMNPGTLVRVSDGLQAVYQSVTNIGDESGSQIDRIVTLAGRVDATSDTEEDAEENDIEFTGGEATISGWAPHPVNINTASREVIYACWANLHFVGADTPETIVAPELAWTLAGRIVDERKGEVVLDEATGRRQSGPYRHVEDLGRWLRTLEEQETISGTHRALLYFNAVNPHNFRMAFGTAPFCYKTMDVYDIEARVAINNLGGEHVARATIREVVEIGSDAKSAITLDSQDDFERRLGMGSGAKWVASYSRGVNFRLRSFADIQPALREYQAVLFGAYPSAARSDERREYGEVRLEPARIRLPGNTRRVLANHFDSSIFTEGWRTDYYGAYRHKSKPLFLRKDDPYPESFTMSFWWQSFSDANWTAFDCGMEKFLNRYTLFVDEGEDGPELVFRVCAGNLEGRGAEIFVPLERIGYRPGQWYHIQVSARGEDPSLMELFIDGVAMGERRGFSFLASQLTEGDTEIHVENTDGFPAIGALMIGDEVVEYETRGAESFQDCWRGARGTHDAELGPGNGRVWPEGTPVRQLGFSSLLLEDVMAGGASLTARLGRWTAVTIQNGRGEDSETIDLTSGTAEDGDLQFWTYWGIPQEETTVTLEIDGLWGETTGFGDAFGTSGIALMGGVPSATTAGVPAPPSGDDDVQLGGLEFVYYTRSEGDDTTIQIEKRFIEREGWTMPGEYFLPTRVHYVGQGTEVRANLRAYLVPISIEGVGGSGGVDDYFDPAISEHQEQLLRFPRNWNQDTFVDPEDGQEKQALDEGDGSARVLIGLPNDVDDPRVLPECIRYDALDRQTSTTGAIYFVSDRNLVRTLVPLFFPGWKPQSQGSSYDPQEDPVQEGEVDDAIEEDTTGGEEDIEQPGDEVIPPDAEPEFDTSGGGDSEAPEDGEEVPDELIDTLEDPQDVLPDLPDAQGPVADDDESYPWPSWVYAKRFVHLFFRGTTAQEVEPNEWVGPLDRVHEQGGSSGTEGDRATMILPCFRVYSGPRMATLYDADEDRVPGRPLLHSGARPAGRNDVITLSDGHEEEPRRLAVRIRWAARDRQYVALDEFPEQKVLGPTSEQVQEWATSTDALARDVLDPRGNPRILRMPCGELPEELPEWVEFAQSTLSSRGVVTAYFDELHVFRHSVDTAPLLRVQDEDGVTEEADEITVAVWPYRDTLTGVSGHHEDCGILSIDGELIVYRTVRSESEGIFTFEDCTRGVLGTEARAHPLGTYGRFVPDVPVTCLVGNVTRESNSISVAKLDSTWPRKGLLRVLSGTNVELIHYTHRTDEAFELPEALDADESVRGRGLLRGRFGTDVTDHDDGDLIFYQPFRYWDRYMPRRTDDDEGFAGVHDHPEGAYLEIGQRFRTGYWHRISWKEDLQGRQGGSDDEREASGSGSGYLDILVLARLNPQVPWDSKEIVDLRSGEESGWRRQSADATTDKLYLLDDPEAANKLGLESDILEMRIYFMFRPGAFTPSDVVYGQSVSGDDLEYENSWKASPWLREVTMEYTSKTSTIQKSIRR